MGERFPIKMSIGGTVTESQAIALVELMKDAEAELFPNAGMPDSVDDLRKYTDNKGQLEFHADEAKHYAYDDIKAFCIEHSLSWEFYCGADWQYTGDYEYWAPGMDGAIQHNTTPDGDLIVHIGDLLPFLDRYYASVQDLQDDLKAFLPDFGPKLPPFVIKENPGVSDSGDK